MPIGRFSNDNEATTTHTYQEVHVYDLCPSVGDNEAIAIYSYQDIHANGILSIGDDGW